MVLSPTPWKVCQRGSLNGGTPLYLNPDARVNTILTHLGECQPPREIPRRETTAQRDGGSRARAMARSRSGTDRSSPAAERENLDPASVATVLARVWDEALLSYEA